MSNPPVISIVGRSKSGRTTLLEKLIRELKHRGYRVGTVKHHSHPGFEVDQPGKGHVAARSGRKRPRRNRRTGQDRLHPARGPRARPLRDCGNDDRCGCDPHGRLSAYGTAPHRGRPCRPQHGTHLHPGRVARSRDRCGCSLSAAKNSASKTRPGLSISSKGSWNDATLGDNRRGFWRGAPAVAWDTTRPCSNSMAGR